jgi:uncharacterized SAM-binding protein YcdF (DUF218 family)
MPFPLCLALLAAAVWLHRSARGARLGRRLLLAALLLLLLFGNRAVSLRLAGALEGRYPAVPELPERGALPPGLPACRYVVVLGGGHADVPAVAALDKLSTASRGRIAEGVRILRVLPDARLIVSGPGEPGEPTHASVLAAAAVSLGVDPGRILMIDQARDTEDESHAVKAIVGDEPVALVTSAWHMPRAESLFVRAGVRALPCPADFISLTEGGFNWSDLGWDVESLERSTWAVHENAGIAWNWIRRKLHGGR